MTDSKITLESVNKAFEFLEKATEVEQLGTDLVTDAPLEKGDKAAAIDEKDKEKESEDLEKAVEMCKSFDPKKSKEEMVEECKKGGFAEATAASAADSCIAAANAAKDGGTISTVQPSLVKAEEVQTLQVGEDFQGLVKGLATTLIQHSDKKFQSIGNILKYESEQNIILKGQVDALTTKVETLLAAPQPKKSITTAQAVERFDKGQEAGAIANGTDVYDLNKSEDVSLLGDRLMNEALVLRESGNVNSLLEKAVGDLDISKSLPVQIIPYLKAKKIAVIMPGQTGIEK